MRTAPDLNELFKVKEGNWVHAIPYEDHVKENRRLGRLAQGSGEIRWSCHPQLQDSATIP
jgi:hypothetical protein